MPSERLEFLYGPDVDVDAFDLDDIEVRADLLERSFPAGLDVAMLFSREVVANQIYADDPPEVWPTAQRLLSSGLDREAVFHQLAMAFTATASECMAADGPFDADRYRQALAGLPLPSAGEVEAAVVTWCGRTRGSGAVPLTPPSSPVSGGRPMTARSRRSWTG